MTDLPTYTVNVELEHGWWILQVVAASEGADTEPVGKLSQCRLLSNVDEIGRDLIATALDSWPGGFNVTFTDAAGVINAEA